MPRSKKDLTQPKKLGAPGKTLEAVENQMISLAVDLARKQLSEGTASAPVITHYLKLGSTRDRLEMEKLREENKLLTAKTEALKSVKNTEELYIKAIAAIGLYSGREIKSVENNDNTD